MIFVVCLGNDVCPKGQECDLSLPVKSYKAYNCHNQGNFLLFDKFQGRHLFQKELPPLNGGLTKMKKMVIIPKSKYYQGMALYLFLTIPMEQILYLIAPFLDVHKIK